MEDLPMRVRATPWAQTTRDLLLWPLIVKSMLSRAPLVEDLPVKVLVRATPWAQRTRGLLLMALVVEPALSRMPLTEFPPAQVLVPPTTTPSSPRQ